MVAHKDLTLVVLVRNQVGLPIKEDKMNKKLMKKAGFEKEVELTEKGLCPLCKKTEFKFRDELSRKEFKISGLCQECQDELFGE